MIFSRYFQSLNNVNCVPMSILRTVEFTRTTARWLLNLHVHDVDMEQKLISL